MPLTPENAGYLKKRVEEIRKQFQDEQNRHVTHPYKVGHRPRLPQQDVKKQ